MITVDKPSLGAAVVVVVVVVGEGGGGMCTCLALCVYIFINFVVKLHFKDAEMRERERA